MSIHRQIGLDSYLQRDSFSNEQYSKLNSFARGHNTLNLKISNISAAFRCPPKENVNSTQSFRVTNLLRSKNGNTSDEHLSRNSFKFHMVVGKGGFGKVWIVTYKSSKKYFALKEMSKTRIISKKSVHSVMNEKQILCALNHSFIVNIKSSFQDKRNLYLVMDLVTGGDLRFHVCYMRKFTEEQTRFFVACIVHALEYIHSQGFLHRDIKPENLVFDERGYLRVTDFGISRKWNPDNAKETSGTPGYMSPEVMCRMQHGFESDYYAVGIIAYECMTGRRPYDGKSRKEIRDQILARQESIKLEERPRGWSTESIDFVNRLIARKPHKRLGYNGIDEVINHPWFKNFNWDKLRRKEIDPPFIPNVREVFDYLRTLSEDSTHTTEMQEVDFDSKTVIEMFDGYDFNDFDSRFRGTEQEKSEAGRSELAVYRKIPSSPTQVIKPTRASHSPKKPPKKLSRNYLSVNLLNIGPGMLSTKFSTSKDKSLQRTRKNGFKSKKENLFGDARHEESLSNRTTELPFHSRLRAASDNVPLQLPKWASNFKR